MGTYVKLSQVEGLREAHQEIVECDKNIKRFFKTSKVVGKGKESAPVTHVAFSPNGAIVSICSATKVLFYDYIEQRVVHTFSDSKEFVRCCSFRSDGKVAAVSDDGGWVQLIALGLKSNLKKWRAHQAACHALQFSCAKTRMMTGGDDGVAKLWDTVTGELVEEFNFHADKIRTLSDFCGSEHLWVTGGYDSVAYLFDVRDSSKPVAKVNHGAPIEFVELSAANNLLVTVGGNMLKLWDVSNGLILLYAFEPHQRTVVRGYVRDSILTASLDGTVRYFNYSSGYQSGHGSFDDKYVSAVSGGALVDAEEGSLAPSPVTRSTGGASELEREVESDGNYVDTVKGLASAEEERKSPTNTIAANEEMHSDSSDFVTPLSNGFSPGDHFTPMSDDGSVSDCGGDTPMVSEGSTKRKRVSPKMGGKMRGLGGLLSDPTEERPVSLRHVYRFNDPVVSFAVSLDAKSIAVGLSSGEWVIRHNTREASEEEPQAKKVIRIAENVVEYKTAKLSLLDRLVKTFQYQAAMDLSLSLTPNHVYNLVETLILRGSLATAVRGKDEQTILPLLRFVSSHLGNDIHNTNTLLELAHAVLDNNQWLETCDNTRVIQELRKIPNKINFELFQHNILQTLKGSLDLVLNRQVTVNESYD